MLWLAKHEDDLAADELAQVPYWKPAPPTAPAHRGPRGVLRQHANAFLPSVSALGFSDRFVEHAAAPLHFGHRLEELASASTSSTEGLKAFWTIGTCRGWITHLP